jgi:hypothetical protein
LGARPDYGKACSSGAIREGAQFDWEKAWEFQLSTWSATPRDFSIYVDQIAAEK